MKKYDGIIEVKPFLTKKRRFHLRSVQSNIGGEERHSVKCLSRKVLGNEVHCSGHLVKYSGKKNPFPSPCTTGQGEGGEFTTL